ncbi:MAG: hypothetical protein QG657_4996 [Acidobacteriota bacterium]|nr:hypothetical protein [Acidobacteriota bacterium]
MKRKDLINKSFGKSRNLFSKRFLVVEDNANKGFTLVEIVLVIMITSILVVMIFQALDHIRQNEARLVAKRDNEKQLYILFNALANLFKNTSSFTVFNNREESPFFLGTTKGIIFLSRAPLVFPYGGMHFIELQFDKNRIWYREKPFRESEEREFVSFAELKDRPFYPLLENVTAAEFQYYLWDRRSRQFNWKKDVNSFEKDELPLRVSLRIDLGGKLYELPFDRIIKDKNEKIPPLLLAK